MTRCAAENTDCRLWREVQLLTRNAVEDVHYPPNHRSHTIHPRHPIHGWMDGPTYVRSNEGREGGRGGKGRTDGWTDEGMYCQTVGCLIE